MDAQAHRQLHPAFRLQASVELPHGFHHSQSSSYCPLRIIFVRLGIAKVDQQPIAQILRDMPLKAGDHLATGVLISPHHLAPVFGVKLTGEHGRVHEVTKQHGELAAFGLGGARSR
jgi:hypothetical protein